MHSDSNDDPIQPPTHVDGYLHADLNFDLFRALCSAVWRRLATPKCILYSPANLTAAAANS